jgi:glycosyltransferase involved in cell wall biosynthesis
MNGNFRSIQNDTNERKLAQSSHLFYAVSPNLCDYYERNFHRRPKLLVNGVSEDYFDLSDPDCDQQAHNILSCYPVNRVCFFGSIIGVLDLDLIIESSQLLPGHHFIFLGSIRYQNNPVLDEKVDQLLSLPNVHRIGPFKTQLLPYLLNQMDIFLLLYANRQHIWTYYSSPAKLFEYMALGKPIISTPHPFVQKYGDLVYIVRNCGELCDLIHSLSGNGYVWKKGNEMRRLAFKHLWSQKKYHVLKDLNEITQRGIS